MSLLPSTWLLRRLRRAVVEASTDAASDAAARIACGIDAVFVARLHTLRCEFCAAVECGDSHAPGIDVFLRTWRAFSLLPVVHQLHLRPLYERTELVSLLRNEAAVAILLERVHTNRGPGVPGTGHRVLGGALGVGKTYILRGLALVLATLGSAVSPVTWNYEAEGASSTDVCAARAALVPISVLLDASDLFESSVSAAECAVALRQRSSDLADDAVPAYADAVSTAGAPAPLAPVLLLDEVNAWYRDAGDPVQLRGMRLVQQLLHFARRPQVHAVVAGSASCLREQMFALDSWAGRGYPSLNATLFAHVHVQPLRDVGDLSRFLDATGAALPEGMDVQMLLSLSGGIGRVIADVLQGHSEPCARVHPVHLFSSDPTFAMLVTHILTVPENAALLDDAGEWPPPVGLSKVAVVSYLRDLGFGANALALLERWRDCGVLFLGGIPERYELLFPYHARLLRPFLASPVARLVNCVRIQLYGVAGSLGNALEDLCRPQLAALFPGAVQRGESLVMRKRVASVVDTLGAHAPFAPLALLGRVIRWASQVGIEDFVLTRDEDEDVPVVLVDGWQCKSPVVGSVMRAGAPVFAAVIRDQTLASASDAVNYLSHASVKAAWGMCALLAILTSAAGEGVTFRPRTIYLRTTAVLDAPAQDAAAAPVPLSAELIAAFNASAKSIALGARCPSSAAGTAFVWHVCDGVGWIDSLLSPGARGSLTTPELFGRAVAARG